MTKRTGRKIAVGICILSTSLMITIIFLVVVAIFSMLQDEYGTANSDWNRYHLCLAKSEGTDAEIETCEHRFLSFVEFTEIKPAEGRDAAENKFWADNAVWIEQIYEDEELEQADFQDWKDND